MSKPTRKEEANIKAILTKYREQREDIESFVKNLSSTLTDSSSLRKLIHSVKWRVKDEDHLKEKLLRKLSAAKERHETFDVTTNNVFEKINDLAGFRILHLHTRQFGAIHEKLMEILNEQMYTIIEGPIARTWDDESRDYFKEINIETKSSGAGTMYTSVHYIVKPNRKTFLTGEIQVRTLAEEIWGEVDHQINYPNPSDRLTCREQIRVLARVTSSCSRLVDSIFLSHNEPR